MPGGKDHSEYQLLNLILIGDDNGNIHFLVYFISYTRKQVSNSIDRTLYFSNYMFSLLRLLHVGCG